MGPKVSIIIPCYNAAKFIEQTLNSVIAQTYNNYEVIIVNDGSTDDSVSKINPFITNKNFKLISKVNGGVSSARNIGLENANGDYVALLDADDVWLPNNLKEKITLLEQDPELFFVYSDMIQFDTQGVERIVKGFKTEKLLSNYLLQTELPIPGACSNVVFRNNKVLKFDIQMSTAADQDFIISLIMLGKAGYLNEPLWKYRVFPNSMSKNVNSIEKDQLYMMKKYSENKLYKGLLFKRKAFANNYLILAGCFWKDANNKLKGLYYTMLAVLHNPLIFKKLAKKVLS